jgi:CIC family chloride channel protein
VLGTIFIRVLYAGEDLFDGWHIPWLAKSVVGSLLLGLLAVVVPRGHNSVPSAILGVGYPTIDAALYGHLALGLLLLFMVTKLLAVALTIGSGGSGGVFAPSLFLGAMLGSAYGDIGHHLLPGMVSGNVSGYAIAGMAAVFAGAAQAPITAIMILFELTTDYTIILPLMLTVVTATVVGKALCHETIYTLKLARRGIDLAAGRDANIMRRLYVRDAMETDIETVPSTMPICDFIDVMNRIHRLSFPVVDSSGAFIGTAQAEDIEETLLLEEEGTKHTVAEVVERSPTVYPDETLEQALEKFALRDRRRIPVVSRQDHRQLLGMLNAWDILAAYRAQVMRESERQVHR